MTEQQQQLQRSTVINIDGQAIEVDAETVIEKRHLGTGNFGAAFVVKTVANDVLFCCKKLPTNIVNDVRQKLYREYNVFMQISRRCPDIVTYYGATLYNGYLNIYLELMDASVELLYKQWFDGHRNNLPAPIIPEVVIRRIAATATRALNFLYNGLRPTVSIIHRDVKPSNLLINRTGIVKLCDYNISGFLSNSMCSTNVGCEWYLSPERIQEPEQRYGVVSDVWSLGVTLLEIALGRHPIYRPPSMSAFELSLTIVSGEFERNLPAGYSPNFQDFINQCLVTDPTKRPKYEALLKHSFLASDSQADDDEVSSFVGAALSNLIMA